MKNKIIKIFIRNSFVGIGFHLFDDIFCTCYHILENNMSNNEIDGDCYISFPFEEESKDKHFVKLADFFPINKDQSGDIALLVLNEKNEKYFVHDRLFEVEDEPKIELEVDIFGYPNGYSSSGIWSEAILKNYLPNGLGQIEGIRSQGIHAQEGYSGSPIFNKKTGEIIGMFVARDNNYKNSKVGFFVPFNTLIISTYRKIRAVVKFETYHYSALDKMLINFLVNDVNFLTSFENKNKYFVLLPGNKTISALIKHEVNYFEFIKFSYFTGDFDRCYFGLSNEIKTELSPGERYKIHIDLSKLIIKPHGEFKNDVINSPVNSLPIVLKKER